MEKLTAEEHYSAFYGDNAKAFSVHNYGDIIELMESYVSQVRSEEREKQKAIARKAWITKGIEFYGTMTFAKWWDEYLKQQ